MGDASDRWVTQEYMHFPLAASASPSGSSLVSIDARCGRFTVDDISLAQLNRVTKQ